MKDCCVCEWQTGYPFDQLTSLPTRYHLHEQLTEICEQKRAQPMLLLNIDYFTLVKISLGHMTGDELLVSVVKRLQENCPASASIFRVGSDEFAILLETGYTNKQAAQFANDLLKLIGAPIFLSKGQKLHITASIGVVFTAQDADDAETVMKYAEKALYTAKQQGRNTFAFYTQTERDRAIEWLHLNNELRGALSREEFSLCYQPQVNVHSGKLVGLEALLRWESPTLGKVTPDTFIPILEGNRLILEIGEWVLLTACKQGSQWIREGYPPLKIAVNLSVIQLLYGNLAEKIASILETTGLDANLLEIEITESTIMQNIEKATETLKEIKKLGVTISIDDFGTGYSSLGYLKKFPVDTLKIDRTFINEISADSNLSIIVQSIILLAHGLDLQVIAEGVEDNAQYVYLQDRQCDVIQGFFVSPPLVAEEIESVFLLPMKNT